MGTRSFTWTVAALGALVGAALLSVRLYDSWHDRPRVAISAHRVYDLEPDSTAPRFLVAMTLRNPSSQPVALIASPTLWVRSVDTGGEMGVAVDALGPTADSTPMIAANGELEAIYDAWRLVNLYQNGIFPQLRRSPDDMRFRLVVETDAGEFGSAEWSGVADDDAELRALVHRLGGDTQL